MDLFMNSVAHSRILPINLSLTHIMSHDCLWPLVIIFSIRYSINTVAMSTGSNYLCSPHHFSLFVLMRDVLEDRKH